MHIFSGDRRALFDRYAACNNFFPLIGAVIDGTQQGTVYSNNITDPSSVFVVHKFGFAQFIEFEIDDSFDDELIRQVFHSSNKNKFRVYDVDSKWESHFRRLSDHASIQIQNGTRERFLYKKAAIESDGSLISELTALNFEKVNSVFDLDIQSRFWSSSQQALLFSNARIVSNPSLASICYGAALSASKIEIDVATTPDMRKKGYARLAVCAFIDNAISKQLTPAWDCYSNNTASLELAKSVGFEHLFSHNFYIISVGN